MTRSATILVQQAFAEQSTNRVKDKTQSKGDGYKVKVEASGFFVCYFVLFLTFFRDLLAQVRSDSILVEVVSKLLLEIKMRKKIQEEQVPSTEDRDREALHEGSFTPFLPYYHPKEMVSLSIVIQRAVLCEIVL